MLSQRTINLISAAAIMVLIVATLACVIALRSCTIPQDSTSVLQAVESRAKAGSIKPSQGESASDTRVDIPPTIAPAAQSSDISSENAEPASPTPTPDIAYRARIEEVGEIDEGRLEVTCVFTHAHGREFQLIVRSKSSGNELQRSLLAPIRGQVEQREVVIAGQPLEDVVIILLEAGNGKEADKWIPVE